jgi:hypothetical protein
LAFNAIFNLLDVYLHGDAPSHSLTSHTFNEQDPVGGPLASSDPAQLTACSSCPQNWRTLPIGLPNARQQSVPHFLGVLLVPGQSLHQHTILARGAVHEQRRYQRAGDQRPP